MHKQIFFLSSPQKTKGMQERERDELIENLLWKTFVRYYIFPFETNSVCLAINFVKLDFVEFVLTSWKNKTKKHNDTMYMDVALVSLLLTLLSSGIS